LKPFQGEIRHPCLPWCRLFIEESTREGGEGEFMVGREGGRRVLVEPVKEFYGIFSTGDGAGVGRVIEDTA